MLLDRYLTVVSIITLGLFGYYYVLFIIERYLQLQKVRHLPNNPVGTIDPWSLYRRS